MNMKKPPHPGRIIRQEWIEPLGLTITDAAKRLGVKRQTLNNFLNGKPRDLRRNIHKALKGLWQPSGRLARASDAIRPCKGTEAGALDQGPQDHS
jgi:transcriptional regulator with XRE-family HTH domain